MSIGIPASDDFQTADAAWSPSTTATTDGWFSGSLSLQEIRRRFWHMAPGLLAFILHVWPHEDPISTNMRWIFLGFCAFIGLKIIMSFRSVRRQDEKNITWAVAGYALSVLATVLMFPQHLEIGVAVLAILAFGDGSATLFGLLIRGPKLPWNKAKSWSGFLAFVVVGLLMASWIYWGETHNPEGVDPAVTFARAVMIVFPAVLVSAIVESIDSRINDNVRVGIAASLTMAASHFLMTV